MSAPDTPFIPKATARPGPFDWYRNINRQERRTFWSCKAALSLPETRGKQLEAE